MVAAGITGRDVVCKIREPLSERLARTAGITRAAAAIRLAFGEVGPGAVWVVGCAPTALAEILTRNVEPGVRGRAAGRLRRRGGGQGRAAGQRAALGDQRVGEGRLGGRRGRGQRHAPGGRGAARSRPAARTAGQGPRGDPTAAGAGRPRQPGRGGRGRVPRAGVPAEGTAGPARGSRWRAVSSSCPSRRCGKRLPGWPPAVTGTWSRCRSCCPRRATPRATSRPRWPGSGPAIPG